METSKPDHGLPATPELVRAGAVQQAENPSGAASAGLASRYPWQENEHEPGILSVLGVLGPCTFSMEVPACAGTRVVPRE